MRTGAEGIHAVVSNGPLAVETRPRGAQLSDESSVATKLRREGAQLVRTMVIAQGFLKGDVARTRSRCTSRSIGAVVEFSSRLPDSVRKIFAEDRLIARSALVATELLGGEGEDDPLLLQYKESLHLLMVVEMTLQMLFDDLLDLAGRVPGNVRVLMIEQITDGFELASEGEDFERSEGLVGFWKEILSGLAMMQRWRNVLLHRAEIDTRPGSVSRHLYAYFVRTYFHVHDRFDSLEQYLGHRTNNCGMPLQGFWAAHWHCRMQGIASSVLEDQGEKARRLLYRYSVLGGLGNDIVGYDKDLVEGVATAVNVIASQLEDIPDEERIARSFKLAILYHNRLLLELGKRLGDFAESGLTSVILWSSLRAAWSIHVLHESYLDVYRPQTLMRVLEA